MLYLYIVDLIIFSSIYHIENNLAMANKLLYIQESS